MENLKPEFLEKIVQLQQRVKAGKDSFNAFGGYAYRSCETIIEACKPVLAELGLYLKLEDDIAKVDERYYVVARASILSEHGIIANQAFAREPLAQKGMNDSQVTGSTSSYARKYALQGLLGLDDSVDADSNFQEPAKKPAQNTAPKQQPRQQSVQQSVQQPVQQPLPARNPVKKPAKKPVAAPSISGMIGMLEAQEAAQLEHDGFATKEQVDIVVDLLKQIGGDFTPEAKRELMLDYTGFSKVGELFSLPYQDLNDIISSLTYALSKQRGE